MIVSQPKAPLWKKQDLKPEDVRVFMNRYGLDALESAIFLRRGLDDPAELLYFLEDDLRYLHNPFLFRQMEDAVERLQMAREEGERVFVFGDRDADGITSTVLLREVLENFGLEVGWRVPEGDEPYGLSLDSVEKFAQEGGGLIVTVDCGISNFREIERAAELGIDVIVLDHHACPGELPPALAIINPKVPEESYPDKGLAGCGVAVKLAWALAFSRLEIYNQNLALVHSQREEQHLVVEILETRNLLETRRRRFRFGLQDSQGNQDQRQLLAEALADRQLLVFRKEDMLPVLKQIFGPRTDIHLVDFPAFFGKAFQDAFQNRSLSDLKQKSRLARYREDFTEMDVFFSIFITLVQKSAPSIGDEYREYLDLVALGTLADMMPLKGENRILIRQGLEVLNRTRRTGLRSLMTRLGLSSRPLKSLDVSWHLTPAINASGRLGVPQVAVELLHSSGTGKEELADRLNKLNQERRSLGQKAWLQVQGQVRDSQEEFGGRISLVYDQDIPRGITGMLANQIMKAQGLPALVITSQEDRVIGSLRAVKGFRTRLFLESFQDIFNDFGGHDMAAGFNLPLDRWEEFRERLGPLMKDFPQVDAQEEALEIDAEIPLDFMKPDLARLIDLFEPFGEGNPKLNLLCRGLEIHSLEPVGKTGKSHMKFQLKAGDILWPAIFWNAADTIPRDWFSPGDRVDVLFHLERNLWQNRESLQLQLEGIWKP